MDTIYIFLLGAIGIIVAIGVGIEIGKGIEEFVIYLLFWMLYIVTIATFINIILVVNYYLSMKDKTGPPGPKGPSGDRGDKGRAGLCDPTCRDSICEKKILDMISVNLKKNGISVDEDIDAVTKKTVGDPKIRFNNIYIKSKIRQMCGSNEFKQLSPYNGPRNLTNYLVDIWKIWFDKLFESGGLQYFENVAAETEFEWVKENPFQEIKQYDVFYWGMGKQYRPQIIDKCYDSINGETPTDIDTSIIVRASSSDVYDFLGDSTDSGSSQFVSFWRAKQYSGEGAVYYPVGDLAVGPKYKSVNIERTIGTISMGTSEGPNRSTILVSGDVVGPIDYDLIWTNNKFWLWRPIAPLKYISLGDVVTFSSNRPMINNSAPIRCVPYDMCIRINPNGNIFWTSYSPNVFTNNTDTKTITTILGFVPDNGTYVDSGLETNSNNCYNMFRTIIGMDSTNIPESDINGGFYYLDSNKYDSEYKIGSEIGAVKDSKNKVGKGYITFPRKESKYSVLAYLNLKNNPILIHQMTNATINAVIAPNAISNAYLITVDNNKIQNCLTYDGSNVSYKPCDDTIGDQIFNIVFTGNKKNECKLRHNDTGNMIVYKSGTFTLVSPNNSNNIDYQLFIMQ